MFDALGLDPYEQAVYVALVEQSPAPATDLVAAAGVDQQHVATVLDALEARCLVTRHPGAPARYSAIDPRIALEVLIDEQEERLKRARLDAQRLAARFQHHAGRSDPAELIEIVTGREAVRRRVLQLQRSARHELRFIDKPPYLLHADVMTDVEVQQLDRAVRYRAIYHPAALTSDSHQLDGDMTLAINRGEEARILPEAPVKMMIIDDRYACLPLQAAPRQLASMVIVHPSGVFEAISALFEASWDRAFPLSVGAGYRTDPGPGTAPTPDDQRLLSMLTAGLSDSLAAKQLNVSPRTVQRRIQNLMTRLGAETRFQAGLQAGLCGWITRR